MTIAEITEFLGKRPYSWRKFFQEMGRDLEQQGIDTPSTVWAAYQHQIPGFVPT